MKHSMCCLLILVIFAAAVPLNCFAAENVTETCYTVYFDDGSYMTESISVIQTRASGTVTGNKIKTYYANDGTTSWKAVLTGTFTYNGSSATCTASSCNVTIYDSAWYVISKSASKSGNTAYASVTMGEKLLGVTVTKVSDNISLKCDKDGNLS